MTAKKKGGGEEATPAPDKSSETVHEPAKTVPEAPAKSSGAIYEAKDTFQGSLNDGTTVFVQKGERVREGHAIVSKWPELFQPLTVQYDIEDATAEPGAKRGATSKENK